MRLSTIAACMHLKQAGHEPVFQVTCRDRNRIGDPVRPSGRGIVRHRQRARADRRPRRGRRPPARPRRSSTSSPCSCSRSIDGTQRGHDMTGNELHGTPDFFAGAVVTPDVDAARSAARQVREEDPSRVRATSRPRRSTTSMASRASWSSHASCDVKVLAGIVVLRSARMARFMNANIPGIAVPDRLISASSTPHRDAEHDRRRDRRRVHLGGA